MRGLPFGEAFFIANLWQSDRNLTISLYLPTHFLMSDLRHVNTNFVQSDHETGMIGGYIIERPNSKRKQFVDQSARHHVAQCRHDPRHTHTQIFRRTVHARHCPRCMHWRHHRDIGIPFSQKDLLRQGKSLIPILEKSHLP